MAGTWNTADIPRQDGRVAVVTGANSGLGLVAAEALAAKGATVVMACRAIDKAEAAANGIRSRQHEARLIVAKLDTADLASVKAFAEFMLHEFDRLDILINNAGIMAVPRALSRDGFELQLATNHLGHFALTGRLLARLDATPAARIVTMTSLASTQGEIAFDDLMGERDYRPWKSYYQSKLANLMFAIELQRRLSRAGSNTWSLAAHPGIATTNLFATPGAKLSKFFLGTLIRGLMTHSAESGTLPMLFAATASAAEPGGYYGPSGFQGFKGPVGPTLFPRRAIDAEVAARLWKVSEQLSGIRYP